MEANEVIYIPTNAYLEYLLKKVDMNENPTVMKEILKRESEKAITILSDKHGAYVTISAIHGKAYCKELVNVKLKKRYLTYPRHAKEIAKILKEVLKTKGVITTYVFSRY